MSKKTYEHLEEENDALKAENEVLKKEIAALKNTATHKPKGLNE